MKNTLLLLLIALAFFQCNKCEQCEYIVESNQEQVFIWCAGAQADLNLFIEAERIDEGLVCEGDLPEMEMIYEKDWCTGAVFIVRKRLVCK